MLAVSFALHGVDRLRGRRGGHPRSACNGVVLYYHAVKSHQRSGFARQMDDLLSRAHVFPAGSPEAMKVGRRNVAVTFDDGFVSVVENAVPELVKRNIPFTVFVPSGALGTRPPWVGDRTHPFWDERVLTATELRDLASLDLATIGSHSVSHLNFLRLEVPQAVQELVRSKAELESILGADVKVFSFPYGAYSASLADQARQAGYERVFTIEPVRIECDPNVFIMGRVAVEPDDWPSEFRLKAGGAYRWRRHFRRRGTMGNRVCLEA